MTEQKPLGTREEFMAALFELAKDTAPTVFALCEEVGDRACGHVEYWGMAFEDYAEVISATGDFRGSFRSPEAAHHRLSSIGNLHLVWV